MEGQRGAVWVWLFAVHDSCKKPFEFIAGGPLNLVLGVPGLALFKIHSLPRGAGDAPGGRGMGFSRCVTRIRAQRF